MHLFRIIICFIFSTTIGLSQNGKIKEIFSQKILTEDFYQQNTSFPIVTGTDGKYAIIMDSLGYYGIGSGQSPYPVLIGWENDLEEFELKVSVRLKNEAESFVIQKLQGQTGQIIGLILKYNPDTQEGLIFETNSVRQYRLSHLKNGKLKSITDNWIFTENLRRNEKNDITIRVKNNLYEFYINDKFEFHDNLERINNYLMAGKFGFYLGANTQVQIDYIYISALKEYNGANKLFNLSEEDAQKLIEEQESIKNQLKKEKENALNELETVIQILENQLKYSNQTVDSLRKEIDKYEPFKDLIKENGNFMHTLTKDLKLQLEKNNILKNTNKTLSDSIEYLIEKQEEFKLEYLRVLDSMIEQNDTINEK